MTLNTCNFAGHLLKGYTLKTNKNYCKNTYAAFCEYVIDSIIDTFNPRLLCVYHRRKLMSIIFISLKLEIRGVDKGNTNVRLMK